MYYALETLWFERKRYIPGIMAVAFSGMLIALQAGIMLGLIGVVSVPIENSKAQIWVAYPGTPACDLARPMPAYYQDQIWSQSGVSAVDEYVQGFSFWTTPTGKNELVILMGCNLSNDSLGPVKQLTAEQKALLTEPGSVVLDSKDKWRVEVEKVGEEGEIFGRRVRCVGFAPNMGSISGPYVLCSLPTAKNFLRLRDDQTSYLLASCKDPADVPRVVANLNTFNRFTAYAADDFSQRSKLHWITKTKAGIAVMFTALLGLLVGASVTSQTLYSATAASIRELAVLRALGIPRWRMNLFVLQQAFLVGVFGLCVGFPVTFGLAHLARELGTKAVLPDWLLIGTAVITLTMSIFSGLVALRSLRNAEPALLLR